MRWIGMAASMTDPFRRSPELEAIAARWLRAYSTRQATAAASLLSSSQATLKGLEGQHLIHRLEWQD